MARSKSVSAYDNLRLYSRQYFFHLSQDIFLDWHHSVHVSPQWLHHPLNAIPNPTVLLQPSSQGLEISCFTLFLANYGALHKIHKLISIQFAAAATPHKPHKIADKKPTYQQAFTAHRWVLGHFCYSKWNNTGVNMNMEAHLFSFNDGGRYCIP